MPGDVQRDRVVEVSLSKDVAEIAQSTTTQDLMEMDTDGDGILSGSELKNAFKGITVRADVLLVRMTAEREIAAMVRKLPVFLFCMTSFLIAMVEFSPPTSTHDVHRHLHSHFGLGDIGDVSDYASMYEYMESFAQKNTEMQPSSTTYWCEDRYSTYTWDAAYSVPHLTCQSPRQYALSLTSDDGWSWASVNGGSSGSSDDHHRRLGSSSSSSGSSSGNSSCVDDDWHLSMEVKDPNATCANTPSACDQEIGIKYCPHSCGYCGPFVYNHRKDFPYGQLTMLPVVVFQTRFAPGECSGFSSIYQKQPHNTALWKLPALDGERNGKLLKCIDRTKSLDTAYAMEKTCPDDAPVDSCPEGGTLKVTPTASFHGMTIYPKMLIEPHHDIVQLEHLQWLDKFTESVAVSTMVYSEDIEIFTSLTVTFDLTRSGNVNARFSMISYRDLVDESKTTFVVCLICCAAGAFLGVIFSVWHLVWDWTHCRMGLIMYEMISRALLCAYPTLLLITWTQQKPMSAEYDDMLNTFLDSNGDDESLIKKFFDVKTHVYAETQWMKAQRIAAYVVLYFQFLQTIFYMSAHPKMGVLTDTIYKASTHLVHFALLFGVLFLMLGFMAHWMLGEHIDGFGTFGGTIRSQVEMMYGDFIIIDGADDLTTGYSIMYWIYAMTFLVVVFFTLLNFFLAIIVDAFCDVKDAHGNQEIISGFFTDVARVAALIIKWDYIHRWPRRMRFIAYFKQELATRQAKSWIDLLEHEDKKGKSGGDDVNLCITPEDILDNVRDLTRDQLGDILAYYYSLSAKVLCRRSPQTKEKSPKKSESDIERKATTATGTASSASPSTSEEKVWKEEFLSPRSQVHATVSQHPAANDAYYRSAPASSVLQPRPSSLPPDLARSRQETYSATYPPSRYAQRDCDGHSHNVSI
jgi:hypothetical protein